MINPSHAVLAATLSALAGAASDGHKIEIDSKLVDADSSSNIHEAIRAQNLLKDVGADYSVFEGSLVMDGVEEVISEDLLMVASGISNYVDADVTNNNTAETWNTACYTNCHSNCHGSRSWR